MISLIFFFLTFYFEKLRFYRNPHVEIHNYHNSIPSDIDAELRKEDNSHRYYRDTHISRNISTNIVRAQVVQDLSFVLNYRSLEAFGPFYSFVTSILNALV